TSTRASPSTGGDRCSRVGPWPSTTPNRPTSSLRIARPQPTATTIRPRPALDSLVGNSQSASERGVRGERSGAASPLTSPSGPLSEAERGEKTLADSVLPPQVEPELPILGVRRRPPAEDEAHLVRRLLPDPHHLRRAVRVSRVLGRVVERPLHPQHRPLRQRHRLLHLVHLLPVVIPLWDSDERL